MKYYVYQLINSINNEIFYIGKGSGKRCYKHVVIARNNHCNKKKNPKLYNKIDKILFLNGDILVEKVYHTDDEVLALNYEKKLIADIGLKNLCNLTIGGEGTSYKNGFTIEHKINIIRGRYIRKLGRDLTENEINNIKNNILKKPLRSKIKKILKNSIIKPKPKYFLKSKIKKILKNITIVKPKPKFFLKSKIKKILKNTIRKKERKIKIIKYKKGDLLPQDVKNNMSNSHKGKKFSKEHKNNISNSLSGRILSVEHKKNLSIANKKPKDNLSYSFLSYFDAKKWIIKNKKINTKNEWMNYTKNDNYPNFLPKSPYSYYKNKEWVSWSDFLGK